MTGNIRNNYINKVKNKILKTWFKDKQNSNSLI